MKSNKYGSLISSEMLSRDEYRIKLINQYIVSESYFFLQNDIIMSFIYFIFKSIRNQTLDRYLGSESCIFKKY